MIQLIRSTANPGRFFAVEWKDTLWTSGRSTTRLTVHVAGSREACERVCRRNLDPTYVSGYTDESAPEFKSARLTT